MKNPRIQDPYNRPLVEILKIVYIPIETLYIPFKGIPILGNPKL